MTALSEIPTGSRIKLHSILGGRRANRSLRALGLTPGVELEILHSRGRNGEGVVVGRDGNRVALGAGVASKLLAEVLCEPGSESTSDSRLNTPKTAPPRPTR